MTEGSLFRDFIVNKIMLRSFECFVESFVDPEISIFKKF